MTPHFALSVSCMRTLVLCRATILNGVDLGESRSGSRVGFRRCAMPTETLGEFRYVKSRPFWTVFDVVGTPHTCSLAKGHNERFHGHGSRKLFELAPLAPFRGEGEELPLFRVPSHLKRFNKITARRVCDFIREMQNIVAFCSAKVALIGRSFAERKATIIKSQARRAVHHLFDQMRRQCFDFC